jgi:hypothetical protein
MIASSISTICTDFLIDGRPSFDGSRRWCHLRGMLQLCIRRLLYAQLQSICKAGRSSFRCSLVDSTHFVFSGSAFADFVFVGVGAAAAAPAAAALFDAPSLWLSKATGSVRSLCLSKATGSVRSLCLSKATGSVRSLCLSKAIVRHGRTAHAAYINPDYTPRLAPARVMPPVAALASVAAAAAAPAAAALFDAPSLCSSKAMRTMQLLCSRKVTSPVKQAITQTVISARDILNNTASCIKSSYITLVDTSQLAPARVPQTARLVPRAITRESANI